MHKRTVSLSIQNMFLLRNKKIIVVYNALLSGGKNDDPDKMLLWFNPYFKS